MDTSNLVMHAVVRDQSVGIGATRRAVLYTGVARFSACTGLQLSAQQKRKVCGMLPAVDLRSFAVGFHKSKTQGKSKLVS